MKQIVSNYSYSPTTNVVTLTGVDIDQDQLLLVVAPQVGRTMYNFASGVTGVVSAGADTRVTLNASTAGLTTTSPLVIFYDDHTSTQIVAGTVTANVLGYDPYNGTYPQLPVGLAVDGFGSNDNVVKALIGTESGGVSTNNPLPISGTVKVANDYNGNDKEILVGPSNSDFNSGEGRVGVELIDKNGVSLVVTGPALNISGTVTPSGLVNNGYGLAGFGAFASNPQNNAQALTTDSSANLNVRVNAGSVTIGSLPAISGTVTARLQDASGNNLTSTSIGGVQRLNVSLASAATPGGSLPSFVNVYGGSDGSAVRTISVDSSGRQNINAQFPRVTLIDGSGTVTTANSAITVFASSSTRSYLLVQVTTGSAFVNVGATATTVNGINLTAGQGYSWETTIPQGIVSLISTTTGSRWVAKEA